MGVLGQETLVSDMLRTNSIMIEVGGSIRRITLDNFMNIINDGNEMLLRQVAWGVPIKQSIQSSTYWGVIGNTSAWQEFKRLSGRYLVTNAGKAAKLNPNDSNYYIDGTPVDESKGNIMVITPRLYYLVKNDEVTGTPVLWMSMLPIGGHYIGGAGGGMYNCIGAYKGHLLGSSLVSRSGYTPTGAQTITSFWNAAQTNGIDFGLTNYDHRKLMMMLGLSEYGDTNIQAKLGYGVGGSSATDLQAASLALLTGETKELGDSFGKIDISLVNGENVGVGCSRVNLMGIEDPYGWMFEMIQNIYCGNQANSGQDGTEVYIIEGNRMPTAAELASTPNGKYRQISRLTTSGYIKEEIIGEYFDLFPSNVIGGSSTSYWPDNSNFNADGQLVVWGGSSINGASSGPASVYSPYAFSYANQYIGSRLTYFGPLTFVNGANI